MKIKQCTKMIAGLFFPVMAFGQQTVYLSPQGNDCNNGSRQAPFLTLHRAFREAMSTDRQDTLYIFAQEGTYTMTQPLTAEKALNRPVVVKGNEHAKPVFSGGIRIAGWQPCGQNLYRAFVPEVLQYGYTFEQFYVDGKRAIEARTPNKDWFFVESSTEVPHVQGVRSPNYATQKIILHPEDFSSLKTLSNQDIKDLRFRFYHKWDNTQKHVEYLDKDSSAIYLQGGGMKPWNPICNGSRYMMYGYRQALDQPGEWYLDRKDGYLYYIPREGENLSSACCIAPGLTQWIQMHGEADAPLKNIRFENLSFQYTAYRLPAQGEEPMQAAATAQAGIEFEFADNITFSNCEMMHTGGYAVWFKQGCHHNTVDHCYIADLGAGGVKIGTPYFPSDTALISRHNVVNNSIITHAGSVLPCGAGIVIFHASDNKITHNEISDLLYSGVSVGWVWGYNHSDAVWTNVMTREGGIDFKQMQLVSPAVRNTVAYNHIHHIGWGELSDMGAVYTLGESTGTRITHNVIHDVVSYDYGGWGLYTDEGSTDVEMSSNLVYRCKSGGFHQHYGKNNKIENNIFAFGHYYQCQYTRVEPHRSFYFRHNIILQDKGETLAGPWEQGNIEMKSNLYWHTNGNPEFDKHSFKEWKKLKDHGSVIADPCFMDAVHDDYRFRSLKSVRKIGFIPFDPSQAGVYGSEAWKQKAQLTSEVLKAFEHAAQTRLKK